MTAIHQKTSDALFWAFIRHVFTCCDKDNDKVSVGSTRNEMLGAIYDPVITIPVGSAFHAADIRAGIRFSHGKGIHTFTLNRWIEVFFALFAFTCHQDVLRTSKEMRK